eukprot:GGOE01019710.1.p1 GENE.GGOE01019710.1~~GGOE01019710.1.p1  ORF type:complete len:446 (+),score=130.32 GGOE01019710.1:38-1339(+)
MPKLTSCLRLLPVVMLLSVLTSGALLFPYYSNSASQCPRRDDAPAKVHNTTVPASAMAANVSANPPQAASGPVHWFSFQDVLTEVSDKWPPTTMDRTVMLDKKFELSSQLLRRYMAKYHHTTTERLKRQLELQWLGNSTTRPFPQRNPAVNVALLTPHEGPAGSVARIAHYTKQLYSRLHGYDFILDTTSYAANHTRHPTWNRVPSLQRHLPHYEWIFYLDSDIAMANVSILLEDFIHRFPPDTYIAFFFIRNVKWAYWLLEEWWRASDVPASHRACDSLLPGGTFRYTRCMFRWNDQVALWDVVLPYYRNRSHASLSLCKTSPSSDWDASMRCYGGTMARMGFPYQRRSAFHFHFWPLQTWPRGFTFFYLERRTLAAWTPEELFHPGDFVLHCHVDSAIQELSAYHFLQWLERTAPPGTFLDNGTPSPPPRA